ncbi:MAG: hypothetical protein K2I20_00430 [Clostridia bacterium]|nr:hypothetical protein [Clostridia bacterium]MDE6355663.1 hypothetical protein [Clostridia bacterium]MDE7214641.1 hypothetical protein [Clostridia bacterium]
MAKKNKKIRETTIENYYDLKVDKVDELVAALKDDGGASDEEISFDIFDCTGVDDPKNVTRGGKQKKFDPYKTDFLGKVPACIKALFVKWWFAGMVCFFFMWGIGLDGLDAMVLLGAVLGIVVDALVNPLLRYMETDKREYNAYMMFPFPFKAFWTFFTNIIYYVLIMVCVNYCYLGLNELINFISGNTDAFHIAVGVEPLLFGTFCVLADMVFIGIKDLIVWLVKRGKKEKSNV